jgi:gas vesicle protein
MSTQTPFTQNLEDLRLEADNLQLRDPTAGKAWHELLDSVETPAFDREPLDDYFGYGNELAEWAKNLPELVEAEFENLEDTFEDAIQDFISAHDSAPGRGDAKLDPKTSRAIKALIKHLKETMQKRIKAALKLCDETTLAEEAEEAFKACKKEGWAEK